MAANSIPFILVLDDYHVIQSDWIHNAIGFLIEHQPPEMHLIITTRVDPQLPLAQLRARGQLTEIRDRDLLFTTDEVVKFLNDVMGLDLPAQAVATIERRTEGWIAGCKWRLSRRRATSRVVILRRSSRHLAEPTVSFSIT